MFALLVKHGHPLSDIRDTYTIPQVHLFYRLAVADDLRSDKLLIQGNFLALQAVASAALGGKSAGKTALKGFSDYIDSLDLNVVEEKKKLAEKQAADPAAVCSRLGILSGAKRG